MKINKIILFNYDKLHCHITKIFTKPKTTLQELDRYLLIVKKENVNSNL